MKRRVSEERQPCASCGHWIRNGASNYGGYCWGCLTEDQRAAWRAMEEQAGHTIPGDGQAPWEDQA